MKPDLGNFGVQALAHLHSSMGDEHCAIGVDVHQRCSLVQELGGEGDAKLGGDDSQATLAPSVSFVEVIHCRLPLCKMCLADHTIPARLHQNFASAYWCVATIVLHATFEDICGPCLVHLPVWTALLSCACMQCCVAQMMLSQNRTTSLYCNKH